jgi:hypothetical protein
MNKIYDINSILSAIEEINNKSDKEPISLVKDNYNKNKKDSNFNDDLLPTTEKLILEAEEHSKKKTKLTVLTTTAEEHSKKENKLSVLTTTTEDVLILNNEYYESNLETSNSEEIKQNIIDDLYSSLSKKIKKNTLKTIFDLHKKISNLEKQNDLLRINKSEKELTQNNYIENQSENNEHLINEDISETNNDHIISEDNLDGSEEYSESKEENNLTEDTIKTLKHQNSLIKNFEKNEEKLRLKIVDLEQNITLLGKKENKLDKSESKFKSESILYRDNYERLIIENNNFKQKLANAKAQIIIYEKNNKELKIAFDNLNNILSNNSVIKINQSPSKDSPTLILTEESS